MEIRTYAALDDFKSATGNLFNRAPQAQTEHQNVLILRILQGIADGNYGDYHLFTVQDNETILLAAAMTPPHNLALSQGNESALPFLINYVKQKDIPFPGINGPAALTSAFATIWNATEEKKLSPAVKLPFYVIPHVMPPNPAPGQARLATSADLDLLTAWLVDFSVEAGMMPHECVPQRDKVKRKIQHQQTWIWEDPNGTPVCFAGHGPATANGMTIGPVYTPPAHRGQGYASNLVAALSQSILARGTWCGLFADAKNPVSNKIYQQIGYTPVFEYQEYRF